MPIDMKGIIADTLLAMTKQKGIDKVTVKALIEECHISRQTFYYHFQDILEVIQAFVECKAHDLSLNYSDVEVALNFYSFGISGLLLMYCQHDDIDTKKLAKQISQILPSNNHN